MWFINSITLFLSALAAYLTATGRYRAGFWVSLASQPFWFALGWLTGAWANCVFSIFMWVCNIQGLVRTSKEKADWWKKFCWYFKIGWEACDNHGHYWNRKLKVIRHESE